MQIGSYLPNFLAQIALLLQEKQSDAKLEPIIGDCGTTEGAEQFCRQVDALGEPSHHDALAYYQCTCLPMHLPT